MGKFREWLREAEEKTTEYQKFFAKKLEKYGVKSPSELSDEDKKKFYDEVDTEWEGEDEKPEDNVNEGLQIKSKIVAMYYIKECIDLEKDSSIKNKLQAVFEFLSKEFKIPIED